MRGVCVYVVFSLCFFVWGNDIPVGKTANYREKEIKKSCALGWGRETHIHTVDQRGEKKLYQDRYILNVFNHRFIGNEGQAATQTRIQIKWNIIWKEKITTQQTLRLCDECARLLQRKSVRWWSLPFIKYASDVFRFVYFSFTAFVFGFSLVVETLISILRMQCNQNNSPRKFVC